MDSIAAPFVPSETDTPAESHTGDLPFMLPGRPAMRYDFPKAWHHFKELIKDKENTAEVFPIFMALPWRGVYDAARAFLSSERGQKIRASEPSLVAILDDHASLRKLPAGTVAHAYCDFMEREGLTAQGLVEELDRYRSDDMVFKDQMEWYFNRLRDTHDLMHVLTGFGRDALGEQCVLAFTYSQQPALAHLFLGYAGALEIRKNAQAKVPLLRAVREGQRMGKACPRIAEMPIRELLAMPLDEARAKLGIRDPHFYRQAHATWRAAGIDPYDLLAPVQQAA
jgi:ubiquinone biosynthesis protein COQ4